MKSMIHEVCSTFLDMIQIAILALAVLLIVAFAGGLSEASAQNTWSCQTTGNMTFCSGFQNGRFVSCTTTYLGGQSYTTCN